MRNATKLVGGGWAGNSATGCLALCVSNQMQALSQGLWVLCAEMGVAWHMLGAGEVSEP